MIEQAGNPHAPPFSLRSRRAVGLAVLFWSVCGLLFASSQLAAMAIFGDRPINPLSAVVRFLWALGWIPTLPLAGLIARRYPLEKAGWGRRVAVAVVVAFAVHLLICVYYEAVQIALNQRFTLSEMPWRWANAAIQFSSFHPLFFLGLVAAAYAIENHRTTVASLRRLKYGELRQARLEAQLTQAQLLTLRMQLNPHFLFNTLEAISSLVGTDARAARRMIVDLGELLRGSLDAFDEELVPLREELDLLRRYLDIERVRFRDRLAIEIDVPEEALGALVPTLILQPLVENAVGHGIAPLEEGGRVVVSARCEGERLTVSVFDSGGGIGDAVGPFQEGVGLANTRQRLEAIYGTAATLDLRDEPAGGFTAEIALPLRWAGLDTPPLQRYPHDGPTDASAR